MRVLESSTLIFSFPQSNYLAVRYPFSGPPAPLPPQLEQELLAQCKPFPADNKLNCECGCTIDIMGLRNQIEHQFGKKIIE